MGPAMKFSKNSPNLQLLFWILFLFTIGVLIWSVIFQLDKSIMASGEVSPEGRPVKVQNTYEGTIQQAYVKVGDEVDTNDILLKLDTRQETLKLTRLKSNLEVALIKAARYMATLNKDKKIEADKKSQYYSTQQKIFDSELESFRLKIQALEQKMAANNIKLLSLSSRQPIVKNSINLATKKFNLVNEMYAKGYDGDINLLTMEAELNEALDKEVTLDNEILLSENEIEQLSNQIQTITQERQIQAAINSQDIQAEIEDIENEIEGINLFISESAIKSPIAGTVSRILFENIGQVLQPGTTLVEIIPTNSQNVFYIELPVSSISEVSIGQVGKISLANMDTRKAEKLSGKLKQLDGDVTVAEDGRKYYSGVIEVDDTTSPFLVPGVAGEISLSLGKRSVFVYIFDPIIDVIKNSLRE